MKPAPATPAATPMAALPAKWRAEAQKGREKASKVAKLSDLSVQVLTEYDTAMERCANELEAALQPAAAQAQRESEQPEQALRELAEEYAESIVASYGRATDPETDPNSRWNAHVKSVTRNLLSFAKEAALSPQTDSQEPR